jgi:hypothetical protein
MIQLERGRKQTMFRDSSPAKRCSKRLADNPEGHGCDRCLCVNGETWKHGLLDEECKPTGTKIWAFNELTVMRTRLGREGGKRLRGSNKFLRSSMRLKQQIQVGKRTTDRRAVTKLQSTCHGCFKILSDSHKHRPVFFLISILHRLLTRTSNIRPPS